jgi:hypothetical protein
MTTKNKSPSYKSFWQLPVKAQAGIVWTVIRLQSQVIFSHKFVWFIMAILSYIGLIYAINYQQPVYDRMEPEDVYIGVITMPLLILAVYLNMQAIVTEKEQRTLEVMFTTAGSRYKVWLLRLGTLNALLCILTFFLSILVFYTFMDYSILGMTWNTFVTLFFVGNLTLYFAVRMRSGLGAGMVTGLVLFLHLISAGIFDYAETRYFIFFNPYDIPDQMDPRLWDTEQVGCIRPGVGDDIFCPARHGEQGQITAMIFDFFLNYFARLNPSWPRGENGRGDHQWGRFQNLQAHRHIL